MFLAPLLLLEVLLTSIKQLLVMRNIMNKNMKKKKKSYLRQMVDYNISAIFLSVVVVVVTWQPGVGVGGHSLLSFFSVASNT